MNDNTLTIKINTLATKKWILRIIIFVPIIFVLLLILPLANTLLGRAVIKMQSNTHVGGIPIKQIVGKSDFTNSKYQPCYTHYENGKPVYSLFYADLWYYELKGAPGSYQLLSSDVHGIEYVLASYDNTGVVDKVSLTYGISDSREDGIDTTKAPSPKFEKLYRAYCEYSWWCLTTVDNIWWFFSDLFA